MTEASKGSTPLNTAEIASVLRTVAVSLRKSGSAQQADKFDQWAQELETAFTEEARAARLQRFRSELAAWESKVKYQWDWKLESFRATMVLAQRAITSAMVVNGGAALALLAYMGNTRSTGGLATAFLPALAWLAAGVILAAATFLLSYQTQNIYSDDTDDSRARGKPWHIAAVVALILSYVAFAGGIVNTYVAFDISARMADAAPYPDEKKNMPPPKPAGPPPRYPTDAPSAPSKPTKPQQ